MLQMLERMQENLEQVQLTIYDLNKSIAIPAGRQAHITPAVWVNDRLWYLGGIELPSFWQRLRDIDLSIPSDIPDSLLPGDDVPSSRQKPSSDKLCN